jgi:hypothetical protein
MRNWPIYFLLASAKEENQATSRGWVENYNGHEGIESTSRVEECIANGFVTIDDQQRVRTTAAGLKWLAAYKED